MNARNPARNRHPLHDPHRIRARHAARDVWGEGDGRTRQRTALVIAARILDDAQEFALADWLLRAKPEHASEIAAGVAAHALRRGIACVWDVLSAVDAMNLAQAIDLYDGVDDLWWEPMRDWLIPWREHE